MAYQQELYAIHRDHLETKEVKKNNRYKKYRYGYNADLDCVIISRDGTIGDIYEVQGLRIGLPMRPDVIDGDTLQKSEQVFLPTKKPESLKKIKSIYDFQSQPDTLKEKYVDYINGEFDRRDNGYFFMCNGEPTYLTGTHYMYLNWTKIDIGAPDFRQANRIFLLLLGSVQS